MPTLLLAAGLAVLLCGCSSSLGSGGGGSTPGKTYIVLPGGQTVPADEYRGGTVTQ